MEELIKLAFEIGAAVASRIVNAVRKGDDVELRRLDDVVPTPLKARLQLIAAEEKARKAVSDESSPF
jgi:hypothetical protein